MTAVGGGSRLLFGIGGGVICALPVCEDTSCPPWPVLAEPSHGQHTAPRVGWRLPPGWRQQAPEARALGGKATPLM